MRKYKEHFDYCKTLSEDKILEYFDKTTPHGNENRERSIKIVVGHLKFRVKYTELAREFHVKRQRIHQICQRHVIRMFYFYN